MGFGDYADAMDFRDLIQQMVRAEMDQARPSATYAKVYSIDLVNRSCLVTMTGDVTPVKALIGSIVPSAVDQDVRLEGPPGARYIADVLGDSSTDTLAGQAGGFVPWITASLYSGFSHQSGNNIRYRSVQDHGDTKIQLRGIANVNSSSSSAVPIFALPSGMRRSSYTSIVISRNANGGSNTAVLGLNTDGTLSLDGKTTGVYGTVTGVDGGNAVGGAANSANGTNQNRAQTSGPTTQVNNGDTTHRHLFEHTHTGGNHQHALTSVVAPTAISLDGVEFFL